MTVVVPSWLTEEDPSILSGQNPGVAYVRATPERTLASVVAEIS